MKNIFAYALMVLGLNACAAYDYADNKLDYVDAIDVAALRGAPTADEIRFNEYGHAKKVESLGAISINKFNEVTGEKEPVMVDLKRYGRKVYVETKLFDSENKEKTFFDQSYFNFGYDRKTKGVGAELTFKF